MSVKDDEAMSKIRIENCHQKSAGEVVMSLQSDVSLGLKSSESASRNLFFGLNKLPVQKSSTVLERLWAQINSILIYILIVAGILSFAFHHLIDGVLIFLVVLINVVSGYFMESKAENATEDLKNMLSPDAQVIRDGDKKTIDASLLTPGDIFLLQPGDVVPADGRVIKCVDLHVLESALTGEAHPIRKTPDATAEANAPLAERKCIVYSGTQVLKGTATCVATNIGAECEIGKISGLLKEIEVLKTPLILQLEVFGRVLAITIVSLALATFGIAIARDHSVVSAMGLAVGIGVAAIPEGLPSCITITFSIGVHFMAKKHAIVKSLPAVETLGSVSVICSDKTGTLTINKMTVMVVGTDKETYELNEMGHVKAGESGVASNSDGLLGRLLPGILCNDGSVLLDDATHHAAGYNADIENQTSDPPSHSIEGDPTETCVLVLGVQMTSASSIKTLKRSNERVSEIPFDSATKYMATLHYLDDSTRTTLLGATTTASPTTEGRKVKVVCVKGAPSAVIPFCAEATQSAEFTERWEKKVLEFASRGMRVLAFAYKIVDDAYEFSGHLEAHSGFTLTAVVGIVDPPRPEAIIAIKDAHAAGITVKMITGDHPATALAIGKMMGIPACNTEGDIEGGAAAITGADLDHYIVSSMEAFDEVVVAHNIFARTTPEHKLRIVESLQRQGFVCSMTGDGVNDAPALKAANIGVAMGITGTDVAKNAANVVLTDDNFATIVEAIRSGRCTYNNLVKIITFVLPTNGGQAFSIVAALIIGVQVPITALQVLWINMTTSVTLGLVLAFDQPESDILTHQPRRPTKRLFGRFLTWRLIYVTTLLVVVVIGVFQWEKHRISDVDHLRTISVNMLATAQVMYLFTCRNLRRNTTLLETFGGNTVMYVAIAATAVLQVLFTYAPPLQYVFATANLDGESWGKIILLAMGVYYAVIVEKWIGYKRHVARLAAAAETAREKGAKNSKYHPIVTVG